MSAVDDVDELIKQYHLALDEFVKGNPEPVQKLFSHREDVTLANPLGPSRAWMGAGCCDYRACRVAGQRWRDHWL
jgi:hypothetical protein